MKGKPDTKSNLNRATFLRQAGLTIAGSLAAFTVHPEEPSSEPDLPRQKSNRDPGILRWDIITIGNLSRNRYWGESDEKGVRSSICTCTLITGNGFRSLVDPSLTDADRMATELDRRAGIKPADISMVFVTHEHSDHYYGLSHFPGARWMAAPAVAQILNKSGKLPRPMEESPDRLFDAVKVVPTPGHTLSHHSLAFECEGMRILVAGDSVMTRDFFRERRGYLNSVDFDGATFLLTTIFIICGDMPIFKAYGI